jgi:hypothetical protein
LRREEALMSTIFLIVLLACVKLEDYNTITENDIYKYNVVSLSTRFSFFSEKGVVGDGFQRTTGGYYCERRGIYGKRMTRSEESTSHRG